MLYVCANCISAYIHLMLQIAYLLYFKSIYATNNCAEYAVYAPAMRLYAAPNWKLTINLYFLFVKCYFFNIECFFKLYYHSFESCV